MNRRMVAFWTGCMLLGAACAPVMSQELTFTHISDMHLSPYLARFDAPPPVRWAHAIEWVNEHAAGPQAVTGLDAELPAPQFALATGDLVEYGVSDKTWTAFERAFEKLPYPVYVAPGNHDNTWNAMLHIMRARHGGTNYSFDQGGVHFAMINTATVQEAIPTIDAATRAWLKADLEQLKPGTPVVLGFHHPPYGGGFANPAEHDTFIDLVRDHNVALLLYGHGHTVVHHNMDGIDGIMGGSTFGKNAGYGVVDVADDTLRYVYHYYQMPDGGSAQDGKPGWRKVFEKPLKAVAPQRVFSIAQPAPDEVISRRNIDVVLARWGDTAELVDVTFRVNGVAVDSEWQAAEQKPTWRMKLPALEPGRHMLSVRGRTVDGTPELRAQPIVVGNQDAVQWRRNLPTGFRAAPVIAGSGAGSVLVLAGTDGVLRGLDPQSGEQRWTNDVGAEIVGTPAVVDEHIIFGTGNGAVLAVSLAGEVVWRANVGEHGAVPIDIDLDLDGKVETDQVIAAPVYGAPLVTDGVVYIGDNTGQMHALKLLDGERVWTFARADYAIEHAPVIWDDLVIFGAWDGYLYAVKRHDGTLAWKSAGPKSSEGRGVRYYAPADCRPVVIGDRLYVTDRGYVLGAYNRAGDLVEKVAENVSAIVPAPQGGFFARYLNDHVGYFDAYGKEVWKTAADAGRFPMPPTPVGDGVFVCSDRGLVTQFDGAGAIRNQYQATPGFYVMAPLTATEDGLVIVTGMDGSVTALRAARPIATR